MPVLLKMSCSHCMFPLSCPARARMPGIVLCLAVLADDRPAMSPSPPSAIRTEKHSIPIILGCAVRCVSLTEFGLFCVNSFEKCRYFYLDLFWTSSNLLGLYCSIYASEFLANYPCFLLSIFNLPRSSHSNTEASSTKSLHDHEHRVLFGERHKQPAALRIPENALHADRFARLPCASCSSSEHNFLCLVFALSFSLHPFASCAFFCVGLHPKRAVPALM